MGTETDLKPEHRKIIYKGQICYNQLELEIFENSASAKILENKGILNENILETQIQFEQKRIRSRNI